MTEQTYSSRITAKPDVCDGRPTIRGMRMRVQDVLNLLAAGATREEILEDYPYLEDEDITAALDYAARAVDRLSDILIERAKGAEA